LYPTTPELVLAVQVRITSCVPAPDRLAVCGLPLALSAMLSEAASVPETEGVNHTAIVQLVPAASELPHVLVWAKSLALAPASARLVMLKAALPVLLRVTVCVALLTSTGWVPKARLVGERLTTAAVPVPERLAVCGLPLALSVMLTEAVRLPVAAGVKVTVMAQLPPAATELPHVLVWAKSLALVPVNTRLVMLKAALPVLLRVRV